jgi:hypothetical protein
MRAQLWSTMYATSSVQMRRMLQLDPAPPRWGKTPLTLWWQLRDALDPVQGEGIPLPPARRPAGSRRSSQLPLDLSHPTHWRLASSASAIRRV